MSIAMCLEGIRNHHGCETIKLLVDDGNRLRYGEAYLTRLFSTLRCTLCYTGSSLLEVPTPGHTFCINRFACLCYDAKVLFNRFLLDLAVKCNCNTRVALAPQSKVNGDLLFANPINLSPY